MATPIVSRRLNLAGQKFGRWSVLYEDRPRFDRHGKAKRHWICLCACGVVKSVNGTSLRTGGTLSCGCFSREVASKVTRTHGRWTIPEYAVWQTMKARCGNPKVGSYPLYGGRGIAVCARWLNSFENFIADMGERPSVDHSIERIDNDGPYCPENCRWATRIEQGRNKRNNQRVTAFGQTLTRAEWARQSGIGVSTIKERLKLGWSPERAVSEPPQQRGGKK